MKSLRRKAREAALQNIYQMDVQSHLDHRELLDRFRECFEMEKNAQTFAERLILGVATHLKDLDSLIEKAAKKWKMDRMAVVDRSLLRLGAYELKYCSDIPVEVTINEMLEMAKLFGSENSASFVNGILDAIKNDLDLSDKAL